VADLESLGEIWETIFTSRATEPTETDLTHVVTYADADPY